MRHDETVVDVTEPERNAVVSGYFSRCPRANFEELTPLPTALSGWGVDHMRGGAVTGALARSAELAGAARPDLRPARLTVDLQRAATMETAWTQSTIAREGGRLLLVDGELVQAGSVVARARTLFLSAAGQATADPPWSPDRSPSAPPDHLRPSTDEGRLFYSEGSGWSADAALHRNSKRKQVWCRSIPIVNGEDVTPFQTAAAVADLTSLVTHWATGGVQHINADLTLALTRLPDVRAMGVSATGRAGSGTLSVGCAEIYDWQGIFGYTIVTTIAQSDRAVDTVTNLMR